MDSPNDQPADVPAAPPEGAARGALHPRPPRRVSVGLRRAGLIAGGLLVWLSLSLPVTIAQTGPLGFVRIPVEALVIVLLAVVLPRRTARIVAVAAGVLLAALVVLKALDIGFAAIFQESFNVLDDWSYLVSGLGVLSDSSGRVVAVLAVVGAAVVILVLLVALPLSLAAWASVLRRHRQRSVAVLVVLSVAAVVFALTGTAVGPGAPIASAQTSALAWSAITQARDDAADHAAFAADIAADPFAGTSGAHLLAALRGKDVLLVFVESYGQVALTDPEIAPIVKPALAAAQSTLEAAGFSARSAWAVSPTFGGLSWLAHSTVQSGLWVDNQQRYNQVFASTRLTLTRAFGEAGWHTVTYIPEMTGSWPGSQHFYAYRQLLTGADVGYRGPRYGYALMPDQYIYSAFAQRELGPGHPPVMAEIDTLSSHTPWVTPPKVVPWAQVGDGSVFNGPEGRSTDVPAPDVKVAYARTVAYAMGALASFAASVDDPNLVILAMGDHQPHTEVSGAGAGHDVPVMLITRDTNVLRLTAAWGWGAGLQPAAGAPQWPMDQIRNRLFTTFGPGT